jgi:integrase
MAGERLYRRGRIWWTWFYDAKGIRRPVSTKCRDRRAAAAVARRHERNAAAPSDPASTTTLAEACERFQVDRKNRERASKTLEYYATKLGHLLFVFGEERTLDTIDAAAVDDYIAERIDAGASRHTVAKELGSLRGVLRLAKRRGEYNGDPATVLPEGWSSGYKPRKLSLTIPQARKLLQALPAPRRPHIAFILATGARWGESVRARAVDMGPLSVELRGTKTARATRTVPIFRHASEFAKRARAGAERNGPAFPRWSNVRRDLAAACVAAKLPVVSPNDLRRSAATWLVGRGAPSNLVAYFLGHTTSRMVELVYGRIGGQQLADAFAAVGIAVAKRGA